MFMTFMYFFISLSITVIMWVAWTFLLTEVKEKPKNFSIEAGFNSLSKTSSNIFSMQFFILMIIFIAFDLEILFVFGVLAGSSVFLSLVFIFFILGTLYLEWEFNKLKWLV